MGKAGQQAAYTPSELKAVTFLYNRMAKRPSVQDLAHQLGVNRSTIYNYKAKPEYKEAFDQIKAGGKKNELLLRHGETYEGSGIKISAELRNGNVYLHISG